MQTPFTGLEVLQQRSRRITASLPVPLYERLVRLAAEQDRSISNLIVHLLERALRAPS